MPGLLVQPVAAQRSLRATLLIEAPPDSRPDRMRVPQIRVVQISPAALLVPVPATPASPVYGRCLAGCEIGFPHAFARREFTAQDHLAQLEHGGCLVHGRRSAKVADWWQEHTKNKCAG